ncbi:MAG: hypothetical protein H7Y07_07870 [Pyrinomonadaceae bacterium]|nr:hypothetical protein [Sphingobacteriaceae bacterium]
MLKQYLRLNTVIGISVKVNSDNSTAIQACKIRTSKNSLDFEKKATDLNSVEELAGIFPSKDFLSVNIYGKGILQKQIERIEEITQANFEGILPNAVFDDFYIQNFISGNFSYVSIIRKKEAEKYLSALRNLGFSTIMLSIGPFPVQTILPQLNVYDERLIFDGHIIQKNKENEWLSYNYDSVEKAPFPLKVENEAIHEKLLISYAVAFQAVFAGHSDSIEAHVPYIEAQLKNVISKKRAQLTALISLVFFFLILLVNFFVFSSLQSSNKMMSSRLGKVSNENSDTKNIEKIIEAKENDLKILGWDDDLNKAYFIDQLAKNLPDDVTWSSIEINPIDLDQSRNSRTIKLLDRTISISGFSEKIVPVNSWISTIKDKDWVKNVQLQGYVIDPEVNKGKFTLLINF